jgi:hypothetical protein
MYLIYIFIYSTSGKVLVSFVVKLGIRYWNYLLIKVGSKVARSIQIIPNTY